jgi:hypothetical protein
LPYDERTRRRRRRAGAIRFIIVGLLIVSSRFEQAAMRSRTPPTASPFLRGLPLSVARASPFTR